MIGWLQLCLVVLLVYYQPVNYYHILHTAHIAQLYSMLVLLQPDVAQIGSIILVGYIEYAHRQVLSI